jgi:iron complex transport system substrate-binding protein
MLAIACLCLILGAGSADEYRTVTDMRGKDIQIPADIERVVTIDDGLIEGVMFVLGEEDKIVGIGGCGLHEITNRTYPTVSGETYELRGGMPTVTCLMSPGIWDLPLLKEQGSGINYEMLAGLDPDLVVLHVGSCPLPSMEDEGVQKAIQTIEALGIPVFVIEGEGSLRFDEPDFSTISDEIRTIGQIFGKEDEAIELADYLESEVEFVKERTNDMLDAEKQNVLIFGALSSARNAGGAGIVRGTDRPDSYVIEEIIHAKNAFQSPGSPIVSAEQLLALDPDVILLTTSNAEELYSAPYYQNIGELSAIKNRRVYALPYTSWNCAKRLEYPIDVMVIAKAAYPDQFADIKVHEWVLEFYKNVYGVDEETAIGLRSAQWLDWTVEEDF